MNKTTQREPETIGNRAFMTMEMFVDYLGTGRHTANKLAEQADAKFYIGRRLLINIQKVNKYINEISD